MGGGGIGHTQGRQRLRWGALTSQGRSLLPAMRILKEMCVFPNIKKLPNFQPILSRNGNMLLHENFMFKRKTSIDGHGPTTATEQSPSS